MNQLRFPIKANPLLLSVAALLTMNAKYRSILFESKRLNGSGLLQKANAFNITADKILYDYALDMVSV